MGEYIVYNGREIKIGTCESLYYVTFEKLFKMYQQEGKTTDPENLPIYLQTQQGFLFRFPFPDEDKLKLGDIIGSHDRTIKIKLDETARKQLFGDHKVDFEQLGIVMQKPVVRKSDGQFSLLPVIGGPFPLGLYSVEDPKAVIVILTQIIRNHVQNEPDMHQKKFFRQIALRILKGYNIEKRLSRQQNLPQLKAVSQSNSALDEPFKGNQKKRIRGKRM